MVSIIWKSPTKPWLLEENVRGTGLVVAHPRSRRSFVGPSRDVVLRHSGEQGTNSSCEIGGKHLEDHSIPVSKWLVTLVSKSPIPVAYNIYIYI